jgi:hypothetical protein
MADTDETLEQATELLHRAQGFMSDAEFREDVDTKQTRYLQSISASLIAVCLQNGVIIDMLTRSGEGGDLSDA